MTVRRVVPVITVTDAPAAAALYTRALGLVEVMNHGC